jgi:hypothetical protein
MTAVSFHIPSNSSATHSIIQHCVSCMSYWQRCYVNYKETNRLRVAATKLHATRTWKDFTPPPNRAAVIASTELRVLSCLHSSGLRYSCYNVIQFCWVLEARSLMTAAVVFITAEQGYLMKCRVQWGDRGKCGLYTEGIKDSVIIIFRSKIYIYIYMYCSRGSSVDVMWQCDWTIIVMNAFQITLIGDWLVFLLRSPNDINISFQVTRSSQVKAFHNEIKIISTILMIITVFTLKDLLSFCLLAYI